MPKVSIVIPVYNVEKYIERCVRSLFEQTLDSIEYVFIDDCSPDNSIAVMQRVLEEFPNRKEQVKLIQHEVNQGVGAARNHGVAACTGDYIIHCDPDDWVELDLYETMYKKALDVDADMVQCGFERRFDSSNCQKFNVPENLSAVELLEILLVDHSLASLCNKMFKASIAQSNDICCPDDIFINEDILRVSQMLLKCETISTINTHSYMYVYNPCSASTSEFSRKKLDNIHQVANLLTVVLPQEKFCRAVSAFKSLNLIYLIYHPEITSADEFYVSIKEIGRKTIKGHLNKLSKGCRFFLRLSLVNYHFACLAYHVAKPIKGILQKIIYR